MTAIETEVGIGDIIANASGNDFTLFLAASRILDVKNYLNDSDATFLYMNSISGMAHGNKHSEAYGNKKYIDLIESFERKGYDPSSPLVMDKDFHLANGTHRIAICLVKGIYNVRAKVLRRRAVHHRNVDWFFNLGLDSTLLNDINKERKHIAEELIESGHAFMCQIKGDVSAVLENLTSDLSILSGCEHVYVIKKEPHSALVSFFMLSPCYLINSVGGVKSKRSGEIEEILNKRYNHQDVEITISKNCIRENGKIIC